MKKCIVVAAGLAVRIGFGAVEVGGLPAWEFVDTEVSTNVPFAFPRVNVKHLFLSMELAGTPSNNVQVAFGRDANTNGVLEVEETGVTLGWDCGRWKVREGLGGLEGLEGLGGLGGLEGLEGLGSLEWCAEEVTTNRMKVLDVDLQVKWTKGKRLVCTENGEPLDWGAGPELPQTMYDNRWDTLRLAVRGVDRADESLRAAVRVEGMKVIIQ